MILAHPLLVELVTSLGGTIRQSKRHGEKTGVPHGVINYGGVLYGICYFQTTGQWRVYYPYCYYPPFPPQTKILFNSADEVYAFFHTSREPFIKRMLRKLFRL